MYTLKQLQLFLDLGKCEKIIETAKRFEMSQSAVSMAIKELERLVGEALFERIGKRLVLNDRGALLMREAAPHVEALQDLFTRFGSDALHGELRMAASVTIAEYLMPRIINGYLMKNPPISIALHSANTFDVMQRVREGEVDLGFIEGACTGEGLVCEMLMHDELVVVSSDRSLAEGEPRFIDALADRPWILREKGSGTRSVFLDAIAPVDKELNIWMELERTEAIKHFLYARPEFLSALPRISVERDIADERLFEVPIRAHRFERDFSMITRPKQTPSRLLEHFHAYLIEAIKGAP